ncbi:MAG: hypothetical protein NDJ90_00295 [Oligoflexia bacterium]|nr:hypothetical protein [Oligoflexia bacterium]
MKKLSLFAAGSLGCAALAAVLFGYGATAQTSPTPTPSPSPGAAPAVYVLRFSPSLSGLLVESMQFTEEAADRTDTGCDLTVGTDGPLLCIKTNSCTNDQPACGMIFEGPAGLSLPDVAQMEVVAGPGASPTPGASPSLSGGLISRAAALLAKSDR